MLRKIRKSRITKFVSVFVTLNFLMDYAFVAQSYALTSGPSQPEVQSFEPIGTTEMVDLFTGDFTYNIPLFELPGPNGGYPFNLAYHSGIGMDQEASWTGLGWNLNPGVINRSMRGLPDDFNGDEITKTLDIKPNRTFGVGLGGGHEIYGADKDKANPIGELGLQLRIYYNNYRGVGYSFDPSIGLSKDHFGYGMGVSLDSQEGVGGSVSLSLSHDNKLKETENYSLGIGYNSKRGLELSTGISFEKTTKGLLTPSGVQRPSGSVGGSATYSFSANAYTPYSPMEMQGSSLTLSYKQGTSGGGFFSSMNVSGFYSVQSLKNRGIAQTIAGYGYQYLEKGDKHDLLDFNRANDGVVRKNTPNLAIPSLTYDYYSVVGQGIAGMMRPYRTDIGKLYDPYVESSSTGGSNGYDIGPSATPHFGISASYSSGTTTMGVWDNDDTHNDWHDEYSFESKDAAATLGHENVYFKARGEYTSFSTEEMGFIGDEGPVRARLSEEGNKKFNPIVGELVDKNGNTLSGIESKRPYTRPRMSRNMAIQPIINEDLNGNDEVLGEYAVKFFNYGQINSHASTMVGEVERETKGGADIDAHYGGITALNANGQRYVYGLPVYNLKNVERVFSVGEELADYCGPIIEIPMDDDDTEVDYKVSGTVPGSEEYFSKTEMPPYAHSYLLTSILGADYVDFDDIPGPSDGDFGYWVKFNYVRTSEDYKWRAPYQDANYMEGLESTAKDNKATFMYGEREAYHLASAETKTHISIFHISQRKDGWDAADEFNHTANSTLIGSNASWKLDKIELFGKKDFVDNYSDGDAISIKTVHFEYSYALCPGILNSNDGSGKLTLKKVYFTYQNNTRGRLSPYEFDYNEGDPLQNPGYNVHAYDRWGNYKTPFGTGECGNLEYPYVEQFHSGNNQSDDEKDNFKDATARNASAWHLKKITLPTGGILNVDYEADDYAYVQHRVANQMFKISRLSDGTSPDEIYNDTWLKNSVSINDLKVYFELEDPILVGTGGCPTSPNSPSQAILNAQILKKYITPLKHGDEYQLYYKIKVDLRDGLYDHISGYANIEHTAGTFGVDVDEVATYDKDGSGTACYFTRGFVTLKLTDIDGDVPYHPFAVAAWQHMRLAQPDLLTAIGTFDEEPGSSELEKAAQVKSLGSIFPALAGIFAGFRDHAFNKLWGSTLDLNNSWIRLGTPDKIKYGGGVRVRKIAFEDGWDTMTGETPSSYGQVYEYKIEENGTNISSGVAQYEPLLGGDEIPLRYAKTYVDNIPVQADNSLFFEYPINEAYYPGAVVGYRKVTVKSLTTERVLSGDLLPSVLATGVTEHQFYTAKEFPVISDETPIHKEPFNVYIPLPFIGIIQTRNITASQGYSIQLNDMHGKLKSIKNFGLAADGSLIPESISSVRYNYQAKTVHYDDQYVRALDNVVTVLTSDGTKDTQVLGVEYEFFTDQRKNRSRSTVGGVDYNADIITPFGVPSPWPVFSDFTSDLRTVVTNKIIHKTGILTSVIATDGLSTISTKNLAYDAQTGAALLTSVTNNFNDPKTPNTTENLVYNYSLPGHWEYEGMDAAYKNIGLEFSADVANSSDGTFSLSNINDGSDTKSSLATALTEGDEFIVTPSTGSKVKATLVKKGISIKTTGNNSSIVMVLKFHTDGNMPDGVDRDFLLVRSGKRNLITNTIGTIVSLDEPISNNTQAVNNKQVDPVPKDLVDFLSAQLSCDNVLQTGTSNMDDDAFFNSDGSHKFPNVRELFSTITITGCGDENTCNTSCSGSNKGYHLSVIRQGETTALDPCHCLASDRDTKTIDTFQWIDANTIKVHYIGGTSSLFCACWDGVVKNQNVAYLENVLQATAVEYRNFWDYDFADYTCPDVAPIEPNLYAIGKKGIWRPSKNYYYKDDRYKNETQPNGVELAHDGVYDGNNSDFRFNKFRWHPTFDKPQPKEWIANQTITKYNQNGFEVEDRDILGVYSSAHYGYDQSLVTAVGRNTKVTEMFYTSFDDPSVPRLPDVITHFNDITTDKAHTGQTSIRHRGSMAMSISKDELRLMPGKNYVLSAWVSEDDEDVPDYKRVPSLTYPIKMYVEFFNKSGAYIGKSDDFEPQGEVVEGWQKLEESFPVPATTAGIQLRFWSPAIGSVFVPAYFDDIRIFPAKGNMNSYVYDPVNFRLQAELDENNYATFYSYDEEGNLFLVKKETERGIITLQESRSHQAQR